MSISVDGLIAGPEVGTAEPMGVGGERLHEWMFPGDPAGSGGEHPGEPVPGVLW
ncbi:MAG TPA: hypothetical protein VKG85_08295 [Actinomycetes bacterium]|nr:hypothetical protein [Actinomycetes bacterium]